MGLVPDWPPERARSSQTEYVVVYRAVDGDVDNGWLGTPNDEKLHRTSTGL
jgi:hypothetical protein